MKKIFIILVIFTTQVYQISAQNVKEQIAVAGVTSLGLISDQQTLANILRLELQKAAVYEIVDKYETAEAVKNTGNANCYSKSCLALVGKALNADKVCFGSIEKWGNKIVINLMILDVATSSIIKSDVMEYMDMEKFIQQMIQISVRNICNLPNDTKTVNLLVKYDEPIISKESRMNLSGPRMGISVVTGEIYKTLTDPVSKGGFDMTVPYFTQIGYQLETQYITAGNFQALVEGLAMVTGMERGQFIPGIIFMNGFRNTRTGLEFAFGPMLSISRVKNMYYDENDKLWKDESTFYNQYGYEAALPDKTCQKMNKDGDLAFTSGFVYSIGKTFKSGYLNIPVSIFIAPKPKMKGSYIGTSVGFNINKSDK